MNSGDREPAVAPLNGWKEIAAYLGRSVRSVQRYERDFGLPVHRTKTADGQAVIAHRHEIDEWRVARGVGAGEPDDLSDSKPQTDPRPPLTDRDQSAVTEPGSPRPADEPAPHHPSPTFARSSKNWVGIALVAVAAAAMAVVYLLSARTVATRGALLTHVKLTGRTLQALDGAEHILWTHDFKREVTDSFDPSFRLIDIDGNGRPGVLVGVYFAETGQVSAESSALYLFGPDGGTPRWVFVPQQVFRCGDSTFAAPWVASDIAVSAGPGPIRIWVAFHDTTWWPSFILELTADGQPSLRYVQTGWITSVAHWTAGSASYLVAGGVTNMQGLSHGSLTLIDDGAPAAIAPHGETRFNCAGTPTAAPAVVWLFPPLDIEAAITVPYSFVGPIAPVGPDLAVSFGTGPRGPGVTTELTPDLQLEGFAANDGYWLFHRTFEREGKLNHSAEACPERLAQQFRRWTATTGWQNLVVDPSVHVATAVKPNANGNR